ncbi:MAG: uroporphyrinogen decarboxylase, partial [Anaerolinea sp.]|nr:uroporphyrinogen decarboxylase [Anaerolinea sp.]
PDLSTAKLLFPGAVCGGLRQWDTLVNGTPAQVTSEARDAITRTESTRFILGTGCVLPITAPHSNIMAARQAVEL